MDNQNKCLSKKIEEIKHREKNKCCNYVPFIIPPGPPGPATIEIGTVTTGEPGTDVDFPQDGINSGVSITRTGASSFNLADIATYQVYFNVPVSEAGQLQLTLNGSPIAYTVVGWATGTSDISGMFLIETTTIYSVLTVRNPAGNPAALTITPLAGGTSPVSIHLVIMQIS